SACDPPVRHLPRSLLIFFFTAPPTTELYTLSLHDALPISRTAASRARAWIWARSVSPCTQSTTSPACSSCGPRRARSSATGSDRSEEHTSELQSRFDLVCRLLLEKKKLDNYEH